MSSTSVTQWLMLKRTSFCSHRLRTHSSHQVDSSPERTLKELWESQKLQPQWCRIKIEDSSAPPLLILPFISLLNKLIPLIYLCFSLFLHWGCQVWYSYFESVPQQNRDFGVSKWFRRIYHKSESLPQKIPKLQKWPKSTWLEAQHGFEKSASVLFSHLKQVSKGLNRVLFIVDGHWTHPGLT